MVKTTESHFQVVLAIIPQPPPTLNYRGHFKVINLSLRNLTWAYRKEFLLAISLIRSSFKVVLTFTKEGEGRDDCTNTIFMV